MPKVPLTRSEIMARVRRRDTKPELLLRRALHAVGLRFRIDRQIEGVRADIVFPREKVAIFIDGCFWHCCPIHGTSPKTNTPYWLPKLEANRERDQRQTKKLRRAGWKVIRIWEHQCKAAPQILAERILKVATKLRGGTEIKAKGRLR